MKPPADLSENDLKQIEEAVKKAESTVSGEIVPVLLTRSHHYPSAKYKYALLFAVAAFLLVIIGDRLIADFDIYDPLYYFTIVFGSAIVGFLVPVIFPKLAVLISTEKEKQHTTYQRAETVFLEQEVFNTKQRTGIMVFVSFNEHKVIVMADRGISEKVAQEEWDSLVRQLVIKIKQHKIKAGIIEAIDKCGKILLEKGFRKDDDDTNELSDHLITD
jgi:putative membrane protein